MTNQLEFDPADYTAAEVLAYAKDNPEDRAAIRDAEAAGKARVTVLNALDADDEDTDEDTNVRPGYAPRHAGGGTKSAEALKGNELDPGTYEEGMLRIVRRMLNEDLSTIANRLAYLNSNQYTADLERGTIDPPSDEVEELIARGEEQAAIDAEADAAKARGADEEELDEEKEAANA